MLDTDSRSVSPTSNSSPSPKRRQPTSPPRISKLAQLMAHLDAEATRPMPERSVPTSVTARLEPPRLQAFSCMWRSHLIKQSSDIPDSPHTMSFPSSDEAAKDTPKTPHPRSLAPLRLPPVLRGTATQQGVHFHGLLGVSACSVRREAEKELRDPDPGVFSEKELRLIQEIQEGNSSRFSTRAGTFKRNLPDLPACRRLRSSDRLRRTLIRSLSPQHVELDSHDVVPGYPQRRVRYRDVRDLLSDV